jgi:ribose transport system ATP-binding protein
MTQPQDDVRLVHVSKTFPGTRALRDVSLSIRPGEIHALVGQNGCGKSTLIKILSGFHEPDPGSEVYIRGERIEPHRAAEAARRLGLRFVHQGLGLIDELDAVDNIALAGAYETGFGGRIDWRSQAERSRELVARVGIEMNVRCPVGECDAVERTAVAIARALADLPPGQGTLVLDEPTVALTPGESERLFAIVRDLAKSGISILYVSHYLDEIFAIGDRLTILRNGSLIATHAVADITKHQLVTEMVGEELGEASDAVHPGRVGNQPVLSAEGLVGRELRGVSFDLFPGEILGIAGALGSGRSELPLALIGAASLEEGAVTVNGVEASRLSPHEMVALGLVLVPADRRQKGSVGEFSVSENLSLGNLSSLVRRGRVDRRAEAGFVEHWLHELDVRPPDPARSFQTLSGGNQQKVVLSKWLGMDPHVLVLDEPSSGVDVGARATIYGILRERAAAGLGVLICSSDTVEIAELATRVLVLRNGRVTAELVGADISEAATLGAIEGTGEPIAFAEASS